MNRDSRSLPRTLAVGVVVPVHNEQELLGNALVALDSAFEPLDRWELSTKVVLVLDECTDLSELLSTEWQRSLAKRHRSLGVTIITCAAKNVGVARALGCRVLLAEWSQIAPSRIWLATTDADSTVPRYWLTAQVAQHELGVDHWCGRVSVADWSEQMDETKYRWQIEYGIEDRPVHGANMGFNAAVYQSKGGFEPLQTGEDRALHEALIAHDYCTYFDSALPVVTSARRRARAPLGFAHALDVISSARERLVRETP